MDQTEVLGLIRKFFREQFELPEDKVNPEAHLFDDLGLDSIDALDMVGMLESELDIEVKEDDLRGIRTVQDIIAYIQRQTA